MQILNYNIKKYAILNQINILICVLDVYVNV